MDNDRPILLRAIDKARANGWNGPSYEDYMHFDSIRLNDIIYSHDFAKALWNGTTNQSQFVEGVYDEQPIYNWQHHLKQMVVAADPIKYLGENI